MLCLRASSSERTLQKTLSAQKIFNGTLSLTSYQKKSCRICHWQGLMDELLYGTSFGTEHTEGIDILAVVQVTLRVVLFVQPVLQFLESFFPWALVFIYRLGVDGRGICGGVQTSVSSCQSQHSRWGSTIFLYLSHQLRRYPLPSLILSFPSTEATRLNVVLGLDLLPLSFHSHHDTIDLSGEGIKD